jgi:membrane-bound serine protease (ClpP class)
MRRSFALAGAPSVGASMPRRRLAAFALALALSGMAAAPGLAAEGPQDGTGAVVGRTEVVGPITPVTDDHLAEAIERSAAAGHTALVVVLDTPGGLVSSTRRIVQSFLASPIPVIVHVAPSGADAGSAGTFITYASHLAAMAPATTIGAATPVDLEGGEVGDKVVENAAAFARTLAEERGRDVEFAVAAVQDGASITAPEALARGVVEIIATDTNDLLEQAHGREVMVRGSATVLDTAGAAIVDLDWRPARRLLQLLADPNLAFILLSLGTLAILYEISSPGLGLGGVVGAVSLVLALFALSVLPVSTAGVVLLVVAVAMFVAELFVPGIGVGAAGGTVALLLGGVFLFRSGSGLSIALWVLLPTAVVVLALSTLAGVLVGRSRQLAARSSDDMIGRTVTVTIGPGGEPRGRVGSSTWRLRAADGAPLAAGMMVTVIARENLDLIVTPSDPVPSASEGPATAPGGARWTD